MARTSTAKKTNRRTKARRARSRTKLPKRGKKKTKATKKKKTKAKKTKTKKAVKRKTKAKKKTKLKKKTKAKSKVVRLKTKTKTKAVAKTTIVSGPKVGEIAPSFSLNDQSGQSISSSQFLGKKVVLYFYPKDDTPGCTREACSFRDNLSQFNNIDATILGISFDDQHSHQKFIEKYRLNFSLLSDTEKEVANKYGTYVQKNMYGKTYWGIERSTYIIDPEGKIAAVFRNVRVDGHTEEILKALRSI